MLTKMLIEMPSNQAERDNLDVLRDRATRLYKVTECIDTHTLRYTRSTDSQQSLLDRSWNAATAFGVLNLSIKLPNAPVAADAAPDAAADAAPAAATDAATGAAAGATPAAAAGAAAIDAPEDLTMDDAIHMVDAVTTFFKKRGGMDMWSELGASMRRQRRE